MAELEKAFKNNFKSSVFLHMRILFPILNYYTGTGDRRHCYWYYQPDKEAAATHGDVLAVAV